MADGQNKEQDGELPSVLRAFRPPTTLAEARQLTTWEWYRLATEWPDDYECLVGTRTRA
ncbi:hypothetical protein [Streptomyces nodosus]|uniref:hypothetical protein n=1 Tax=Streptomyces nodosus TaxID=40318 RepID=UPI003816B7C0